MKQKKFSNKLTINKQTVANVNNSEMEKAYGGAVTIIYTGCAVCPTERLSICISC